MEQQAHTLDRIIRPAELTAAFGVSRVTLWRWCRDGDFPEPIRIGPNAVGWRASTIERWMAEREADASSTQQSEGAQPGASR